MAVEQPVHSATPAALAAHDAHLTSVEADVAVVDDNVDQTLSDLRHVDKSNGDHWFVNGTSGSHLYTGIDPDHAFDTIGAGLAACVSLKASTSGPMVA